MSEKIPTMANDLTDSIAVRAVAERLGLDSYAVVGRLYKLCDWLRRHAPNGRFRAIPETWLDTFLDAPGITSGMISERLLERIPERARNDSGKLSESRRKVSGKPPESSPEKIRNAAGTLAGTEFLARAFVFFLYSSRDSITITTGKDRRKSKKDKSNKSENSTTEKLFLEFWKLYPRRAGKGAAERYWKRINPSPELAAEMFRKLEEQACSEQWRKDSGKFIPHPSTWLNQRRWEDESPEEDDGLGAYEHFQDCERCHGSHMTRPRVEPCPLENAEAHA